MSILSRMGKHISKSQTGHICVPTSCPKDTKAGVARETAEEGVDACTDSAAADVGGTDTFSTLLCPRMGENWRSPKVGEPRSFSGEHNAVEFFMCALLLWASNSSSELKFVSQWLHLTVRIDFADTFSASSPASDTAILFTCLLLSSLLNWLGDFLFLPQELLTSSFAEKLKVSLPILRCKEKLRLLVVSAWHNAKHFSTTSLSILASHFHVVFWTMNFTGKERKYIHPFLIQYACLRWTIGPRTVGPRGPTVRGPTVHFLRADSWAPGPNCPGPNCLGPNCPGPNCQGAQFA